MENKEVLKKYGVTSEQLDVWEKDASRGVLRGKPRGEVMVGRPLKFGETMRQVGFRRSRRGRSTPLIDVLDQLGMRRSDYLRYLVDEDLRLAGAGMTNCARGC